MTQDPEFTATLIKMLFFLLLMGGGAAGVLYLFKRVSRPAGPGSRGQLINVLSTRPIAPKKSVSLIQIPGSVLVVGIAGNSLTLLSKIEDSDLIAEMVDTAAQPAFSNLLNAFKKPPSRGS